MKRGRLITYNPDDLIKRLRAGEFALVKASRPEVKPIDGFDPTNLVPFLEWLGEWRQNPTFNALWIAICSCRSNLVLMQAMPGAVAKIWRPFYFKKVDEIEQQAYGIKSLGARWSMKKLTRVIQSNTELRKLSGWLLEYLEVDGAPENRFVRGACITVVDHGNALNPIRKECLLCALGGYGLHHRNACDKFHGRLVIQLQNVYFIFDATYFPLSGNWKDNLFSQVDNYERINDFIKYENGHRPIWREKDFDDSSDTNDSDGSYDYSYHSVDYPDYDSDVSFSL